MERRGRIPVATFRTPEGKTRSRSRVRDPNYNKTDPDTDLFTLLEDNIALKEENELLTEKHNASLQEKTALEKINAELKTQVKNLTVQQANMKSQIVDLNHKMNSVMEEKMTVKSNQQENLDKVRTLSKQLKELRDVQKEYNQLIDSNKKFKEQIDKLMPTVNTNEYESLVETEKDPSSIIDIECIQKLMIEFTQLKTNLNNTELQLYEANEKISELSENQSHLEAEIENLREENSSLTRVAELMTVNMKESVTTNKKLEEALIGIKKRNDEMARRSLDVVDNPPIINSPNEEIVRLRDEITRRELSHGERIVEMQKLMDVAIENSSNDENKVLRLKLEMLEMELKSARERAEKAETQLDDIKKSTVCLKCSRNDRLNYDDMQMVRGQSPSALDTTLSLSLSTAPKPPPPPTPPPPPPPPLPDFNLSTNVNTYSIGSLSNSITKCNLKSTANGGSSNGADGSVDGSGNLVRKQQVKATGLDALMKELKGGGVTLRRARRKTRNNALEEMFDVIESTRKQNRNSKIFIQNHISTLNIP